MSLVDRDKAVVWHPYTQMKTAAPLPIARGQGVYLYTEDGRKLLDGISSWWVNIHGHAHPRLNQAMAEQARKVAHVIFGGATHEPAVELAERLVGALPAGLTRIFYSDNGSTAVEVAIKLALQYWQNIGGKARPARTRIVALHHAYHGDTVGAMSVSAESVFTQPFAPLLFPVDRVHPSELGDHLDAHGERIAAVIVEPMLQGAGGMIMWPAESLAKVREVCYRHGVLMIADEVLTGFGRTGRMFACEHASVTPDIICLSKALTAGYLPMAVTAVTNAVYDAFLSDDRAKTFFHGHSFTANPLACAVALASLDLIEEGNVLARVGRLERQLRDGLTSLAQLPTVADVRVLGGVGVVELESSESSGGYLDNVGPRLYQQFLERGILLRPLGNVLYFMPPYVITDAEVDWVVGCIGDVVKDLGLGARG
jgi:adenosylmethionine---8-amino-7-oxononanoate aminotransferase